MDTLVIQSQQKIVRPYPTHAKILVPPYFSPQLICQFSALSLLQPDKNYHFVSLKSGATFILLNRAAHTWRTYFFVQEEKLKHCVSLLQIPVKLSYQFMLALVSRTIHAVTTIMNLGMLQVLSQDFASLFNS